MCFLKRGKRKLIEQAMVDINVDGIRCSVVNVCMLVVHEGIIDCFSYKERDEVLFCMLIADEG